MEKPDPSHLSLLFDRFHRIGEWLCREESLDNIAASAVNFASGLPDVESCWIFLKEGSSVTASPEDSQPGFAGKSCFCRKWLVSGILEGPANIACCDFAEKCVHASIPLSVGGKTLGVMNFSPKTHFSEYAIKALASIANQVAIAVDRLMLHQRLEKMVEERTAALSNEIAERRRIEWELRKLSSAVERTGDPIFITNREGAIEYVNSAFVELTGFERSEVLGKTPSIIKSGHHDETFYSKFWDTILDGKIYRDVFVNRKKNGALYYEESTVIPMENEEGAITHFVSTGKDITEQVENQEQLHFLAKHDILTGLPNRSLLTERMATRFVLENEAIAALLFLDLDRFKLVNDTLGHEPGDNLLLEVSRRLVRCVKSCDMVSRLGGDEFVILLEKYDTIDEVSEIAESIIDALSSPISIKEGEFFISASIGISLYPEDGDDGSTLLRHADLAMYRAKEKGGNNYQFYSPEMNERVFAKLEKEGMLRHAWERQEFLLHYQPQIDLKTGAIVGVEALLRLPLKGGGFLPPEEFVPSLEDMGLIAPVGNWVISTACGQVMAWQKKGLPRMHCSVNISSRQFWQPKLSDEISACLEKQGFDPQYLNLEITEAILMHDPDSAIKIMKNLKALGIKISVDDFGAGYSSLRRLKHFPIDCLKIDRSFVSDIAANAADAAIAQAVISIAGALKLRVVAKGVETREQIAFLLSGKCDEIQGYYFGKPFPPGEIPNLFRNRDFFSSSQKSPCL